MQYVLNLNQQISFSPDSPHIEILQNVRTILSIRIGTVPLDRDFGLSWEHVDKPIHIAKAFIQAEIIEAIKLWEPRAVVEKVEFEETKDDAMVGLMKPKVTLTIGDENE